MEIPSLNFTFLLFFLSFFLVCLLCFVSVVDFFGIFASFVSSRVAVYTCRVVRVFRVFAEMTGPGWADVLRQKISRDLSANGNDKKLLLLLHFGCDSHVAGELCVCVCVCVVCVCACVRGVCLVNEHFACFSPRMRSHECVCVRVGDAVRSI